MKIKPYSDEARANANRASYVFQDLLNGSIGTGGGINTVGGGAVVRGVQLQVIGKSGVSYVLDVSPYSLKQIEGLILDE